VSAAVSPFLKSPVRVPPGAPLFIGAAIAFAADQSYPAEICLLNINSAVTAQ
jgi:hypothetical protein